MKPGFAVNQCAILADPRDASREALIMEAVEAFLPELERAGIQAEVLVQKDGRSVMPRAGTDLFVVMGGDGAMIHFVGQLSHLGIPFYGLNYGNVGFMMNNPKRLMHHAEWLREGAFSSLSFPLLEVQAIDLEGNRHHGYGLNDIYLQRMTPQSCKASVLIDHMPLAINPILCDGLIVATPLGSTAYSFNITGSLVSIDTPVITLTPIAAHRACQVSSLILPQETRIDFQIHEPTKRGVQVVSDGQSHGNLIQATVTLSANRVRLCFEAKNSKHLAMRFVNKAFRPLQGRR